MKKRGLIAVLVFVFALISSSVNSLESCSEQSGTSCSKSQVCEGNAFGDNLLNYCCIGQCVDVKDAKCENLHVTDISSRLRCESKNTEQKFHDFFISYPSFFANWLIKFPPQKPYPKLWDFWLNISLTLGVLFVVLTAIGHLTSYINNTASPAVLDKFRKHYVLSLFAGLILISLPQILSVFFYIIDTLFVTIIRIFLPNGDILSLLTWLSATPESNILYLTRDGLYLLFLIVLILRYVSLYMLLIFSPIIVALYTFYYTEDAGNYFLRKIFTNITVPILWVLVFVISFAVFDDFKGFSAALFMAAIFYLNIRIYRWYTQTDFSFRSVFKKVKGFVIRYVV